MKMVHDYIKIEPEKKTGAIELLDSQEPKIGKVLEVGPGLISDYPIQDEASIGQYFGRRPVCVNVGQRILYMNYSVKDFDVDGEKVWIIRDQDVIAILS